MLEAKGHKKYTVREEQKLCFCKIGVNYCRELDFSVH